jgi:hypothetical protein
MIAAAYDSQSPGKASLSWLTNPRTPQNAILVYDTKITSDHLGLHACTFRNL